ncbi:MAG: hypothetical protein mread185_000254 [Mycoplasmataceae bacterium]|nr:MAG: hypothetical protein mread185_000254 [Mycoplasmataceae bacterium]
MKDLKIEEKSFFELVKKRIFGLPYFQREYSWDQENWEEFSQSITNFIDIKKDQEIEDEKNESIEKWDLDQQKYFAGDIILQKGNKTNDYSIIIDGQQRLVTIFILLQVIYEKMGSSSEEEEIKKSIKQILFLERTKRGRKEKRIRIGLNNSHDQQELQKALGMVTLTEPLKQKGKRKKFGNILKAKGFFEDFFKTEANYTTRQVYDTIMENFYFALVEIGDEDKVEELFTALNNTGLNLSNSDLLKSLLIQEIKDHSEKEIIEIWERKIVETITDNARKRQTINREMDGFLIDFWLANYGDSGKISKTKSSKPTKLTIYRLFAQIIKENKGEANKILDSLAKHAEVYKNIKDPSYSWWNESVWPIEIFYTVNDISILNYSQLFPVILKTYFKFEKISEKDKKLLIKDLETILLFIFRSITIKEKSPGDTPRFIPLLLEEIENNERIFDEIIRKKWLDSEFENGRDEFYDKLRNYKTKRNKIWEFVLKRYYWRKYQSSFKLKEGLEGSTLDLKQQAIYNWNEVSVEHLIPQIPPKSYEIEIDKELEKGETKEDIIYQIGNVTLLEGRLNSKNSNDFWKNKKIEIKKIGNHCPLEWEKSFLFECENLTPKIIKKRSEELISEFKEKMKLFDIQL